MSQNTYDSDFLGNARAKSELRRKYLGTSLNISSLSLLSTSGQQPGHGYRRQSRWG